MSLTTKSLPTALHGPYLEQYSIVTYPPSSDNHATVQGIGGARLIRGSDIPPDADKNIKGYDEDIRQRYNSYRAPISRLHR